MKLAVPLLLVVLLASGWGWEHHVRTRNEGALSAVAGELAGRSVHVSCQSLWKSLVDVDSRLGDVPFPNGYVADHTHLTRAVCGKLIRFRTSSSHLELDCLSRDRLESLQRRGRVKRGVHPWGGRHERGSDDACS